MKLKLAIGATTAIFAATAAWASSLVINSTGATYTPDSGSVLEFPDGKLTQDIEVADLTFQSGAITLDLNGWNLSCSGSNFAEGSKITNSDESLSAATFTNSRFGDSPFKNVTFSGNVKLVINGMSTKTKQIVNNANNTHIGGTTFIGFHDQPNESIVNNGNMARIKNVEDFGTGPLTLMNGSRINYIHDDANGIFPWSALVVTNGPGNVLTNAINLEKRADFAGDVRIAENSALLLRVHGQSDSNWSGSFADSKGTFILYPNGTSRMFMSGDGNLSSMSLQFGNPSAYFDLRLAGDAETISIGELSTASDIIEPMAEPHRITLPDGAKKIQIGAKNTDSTFYGNLGSGNAQITLEKVGTGTLTLASTNQYSGATILTGGKLKLDGYGYIVRASTSNAQVLFNGGTLVLGENYNVDGAIRVDNFYTTNGNPARVQVDCDVFETNRAMNNTTNGFVKTGPGMFKLTNFHDNFYGPVAVEEGEFYYAYKGSVSVAGDISISAGATLSLYASGKNLAKEAKVSGRGTLKLITEDNHTSGWRINDESDFSGFSGVLEFPSAIDYGTGVYGITSPYKAADCNHFENTTILVSGMPENAANLFSFERHVTMGAFQLLSDKAQVRMGTHYDRYTITFGGKAGSESILNGQFTTSKVDLVKNGDTPLTIGPSFAVVEGSTLTVNAGTLIANQNISGEQNYTVNIASGVTLTGEGAFGDVDLSKNDVVEPALTAETDKTTEFTLLTATSITGTSATMTALLNEVNASDKKGKWKLVKKSNGDGTVTLKCVYGKNAFVIILR